MREGLHKIVPTDDTIIAISTPPGHSGIGIIRISGPGAVPINQRFFKARGPLTELSPRVAVVGKWSDIAGEDIDQVVVTFFRKPSSYTGEDVIEISAHGNPFSMNRIVETVCSAGARVANPGEFTLRAVVHGKLDLLQAEAVREFVDAQTDLQARTALRQLEGSVSKRVEPVKQKLVEIIAHLEAGIDFAEDDVDVPSNASAARDIHSIEGMLDSLQRTFGYGKILAKGLKLVILGKPNVGKSSLFNRLVAADRAIVTEVPGTTRDVLTETISIDGVPVRFADTAGMHETADPVERIGVTRSLETLVDSDFGLVVLDGSSPLDASDWTVLGKASRIPHLIVINKTDLPQSIELDGLNGSRRVPVSAKTGHGFDELQESLRAFVVAQKSDLVDDSILTSARQFDTVTKILQSLSRARESLESQVPHEMVLLDLYDALAATGDLTGEVVTEDILSKIFSTFCIGK